MVLLAFSAALCFLVGTGGTHPPMAGLLESGLWRDAQARSLRNKGLEIKSLFSFDLEPLPLPVGAPGWPLLLCPGIGPPFRPDQKVKLDKSEATREGLSLDAVREA
jgi:hypothetical protein